ncbi:hypothetical protein V1520DRAFT_350920 [Lipomyces starkeyi]|uniref:Zn(2)-C6 fungal-type domain-containing protein n=1 Tax=Lipomyces starkeyi NRRL Y-11557 TaxID=675824 RepID=A0A1E3PWI7_LIPST|nr:hypothetical protein LIPSTDRAFT_202232 [Lipomyces starkeyi NRRL Y-11557]
MSSASEEAQTGAHRLPRKRKRAIISCTECHRRKQKCDLLYPCCSCIKRGKQPLCYYEGDELEDLPRRNSSPHPDNTRETNTLSGMIHLNPLSEVQSEPSREQDHTLLISNLGYSATNSHNTLGIFRKIETCDSYSPISLGAAEISRNIQSGLNQKYKDLVRQLPSRNYIDILLQTFFYDVNWQYDVIDEITFQEQLEAWGNVSYSALRRGPYDLSADTRVFPALLFEVLAQALLYQPPAGDERLEPLKYAAEMTFHDLGIEFSEAGATILAMLGKRDVTMVTVQAGLLRASFLKSSGHVVEAWHALGSAVRDAQEIGLHTRKISLEQSSHSPETEVRALWDKEMRSRMWLVLHMWDLHMAVVLGRPIATDLRRDTFALPGDALERRKGIGPTRRTENDPPTPFAVILAGYHVAYQYLSKVHKMETDGARIEDYSTVHDVHAAILENVHLLPSWCHLEDPDLKFDKTPGCHWLPAAREGLSSLIYFVLLALHRPYIFSVAKSRTQALKAALMILRSQARLFQQSEPRHYMVFNLVYASFDAIVLIAAIYILYPSENGEYLEDSLRSIEWGTDRLGTMGKYNKMAKSAHGVVLALYNRLTHRLASPLATDQSASRRLSFPAPTPITIPFPRNDIFANSADISNSVPLDFNFTTFAPLHPIHDLFYQNLSSVPTINASGLAFQNEVATDSTADGWHFEGTYPDGSFWSLMNYFNH